MQPNLYARKRLEPKADPVLPAPATSVQPGLRFLLEPEAKAEASALFRALQGRTLRKGWLAWHLRETMPRECPLLMRADEVLRGLVSRALTHVSEHPEMPGWWMSILVSVANGHPQRLRQACEDVLAWHPAGGGAVVEDEGGDRMWHERIVIRQTARGAQGRGRWAADWDVSDDEAMAAEAEPDFDFSQLKPTGKVSTEIPF
ncbi:MAG: hypothetical protein AB7I79_03070 [Rhizobiaceae bacterium]